MEWDGERIRARFQHVWAVVAVVALSFGAAACTTTGGAPSLAGRDATIAFESIDGPPPPVFQRLVQKLGDEAQARHVPMVTREGFAPYRVRGYLAAGVEKKKKRLLISWVWDVYDAQQTRAFRIAGEESVNGVSGDAWAAVDDAMLARIAQKGMAQLSEYLRGPAETPAAAPDDQPARGSDDRIATVTSQDDFRPEAFGIFRIFGDKTAAQDQPDTSQAGATQAVPLPRDRPKTAGPQIALAE